MLTGIDISNYQAGIPQNVLAQTDVVICKATEGTGFQDPYLFENFSKAVNAHKTVGAYHFWRPGASGKAQADYFIAYLKQNQLTVDFAVLDFEDESDLANEAGALEFMHRVEQVLGVKCWFYVYVNPLKVHGYWQIRKKHKFWLAGYWLGYQQIAGFNPPMSIDEYIIANGIDSTGIDFAGWQYTPTGRLPGWGADLDLNAFFEDAFDTKALPLDAPVEMSYPVEGFRISQNFGDGRDLSTNLGGGHTGMDFATPIGTPIKASADGVVLFADWAKNLPRTSWEARWYLVGGGYGGVFTDAGIVTVIDHGSFLTTYSHQNRTDLNPGDRVRRGQVIGETGNTGYTFGAHLHFEYLPKPFNWSNGYYGRENPVTAIDTSKKATATVLRQEMKKVEKTMADILNTPVKNVKTGGTTTLADEVSWNGKNFENVQKSISNVRLEVLNTKLPKYGETQDKNSTTSLALEVSYLADNFARLFDALEKINSRLDRIEGK